MYLQIYGWYSAYTHDNEICPSTNTNQRIADGGENVIHSLVTFAKQITKFNFVLAKNASIRNL